MRELSLFSGAGGGLYGSKLLEWETIGYVEFNEYCQKVIRQRIEDGIFDRAPIFTDVREFVKSGAARAYRGFVDVVTGGFPCQPFSVAGKREASNDERDMWPATMDVIKAVQPPVVYLENVPGLLSATVDNTSDGHIHYFGTILRELAEMGYVGRHGVLGGKATGGNCDGERVWIVASTVKNGRGSMVCGGERFGDLEIDGAEAAITHNTRSRSERIHALEKMVGEPFIVGSNDALANQIDRLGAVGNGQDPINMATAYAILSAGFVK